MRPRHASPDSPGLLSLPGRLRGRGLGADSAVATSKRITASASRVLTLTVIDQGASSLSNFALAGIVAHFSGAHELGIYAIVSSTYIIAQGLVRSCTSDCLLTRSETDDVVMAQFERAGYLAALLAALAVAALILIACLGLPTAFALPMAIFAVCFPLMALQDFSRYIGISRHDPAYSTRLDVAWVVLFVVAFVACKKTGHVTLPWLVGSWTGAGALVGLWSTKDHLALRGVRGLLRFWRNSEVAIGWRFAGQFMLTQSWSYAILYLLVFVLSVSDIGIFKLAQLAMGPISVMAIGLQSAMISMTAKQFRVSPRRTLRFMFAVSSGTAVVTALWTALIYFLPVHLMTKALGPTWPHTRDIVLYIGAGFVLGAWSGAAAAGLRALRAAKESLQLALFMLPFLIVPPMVGAGLGGLRGAAIGAVIANAFTAVFSWIVLVHMTRKTTQWDAPVLDPSLA
jgi:O-antigen/teichoic acid export membrane protein